MPRGRLLLIVLVWAGLSAACTDRGTAVASPRDAELSIAHAEVRPRASRQRGIDSIINTLSSERLLQLARDGRAEPGLAHQWRESADGLTWTFTLRQGLTLHDNSALTSSTVVAVLRRLRASMGTPGVVDVTAVEEAGPTELTIRLARPNRYLLDDLNLVPMEGGSTGEQRAGPFRVVAKSEAEATLEAFPNYHRGRPQLGRIRVREYPSTRAAWSAMLRDEIDLLYDVGPDAIDFVEQSPTTRVASFLRPYTTALVFRMDHPVLRRAAVRTALNLAVNRAEIIKDAVKGRGVAAIDPVWPRHWAYDNAQPAFAFDAARARTLLDQEGLRPRRSGQGAPDARVTFTCVVADEPRLERVAMLMQQQLAAIGVDMRLESLPLPEFQRRVTTGEPDAFLNEFATGHGLNITHLFWHSPGPPYFKLRYRSADTALDRVRSARTEAETRAAVADVQRTLRADPPGIFLYWSETTRAVSRRFVVPGEADRDIFSTVAQWRPATPESE